MGLIELREWQWELVLARLKEEYASTPSTYLMRSKMRECLGFVHRYHSQWVDHSNETRGYFRNRVCIDFYNAGAESMFRLKYADILNMDNKHGL